MVRNKRLLHPAVIQESSCVLYWCRAAGAWNIFILQPEYSQRTCADLVTRCAFVFVGKFNYVKLKALLLFLSNQGDSGTALFVTQQ